MVKRMRRDSAFYVAVILCVSLVAACTKTTPPDPKEDLVNSLKGANVEGYLFALSETDAQTTSSLTNNAVNDLVRLGSGDANLPLRYTRIENKKTKDRKLFKSEVVKKDTALTLAVSDLATNNVVEQRTFPPAGPACRPPGQFESINACISDFDCTTKGGLKCQANRTCEPQFAALTCCLRDGSIFSVHLVVQPDNPRCLLKDLVPDLGGLVLSP